MSKPIPIIICARQARIAQPVVEGMAPEYEVIRVCLSVEAAKTDIPALLSGHAPPIDSENIGTKNYASTPVAVILGGGFNVDTFNAIRESCKGISNVPWLRRAVEVPHEEAAKPGYPEKVIGSVKDKLRQVGDEGGMGKDGVWEY